MKPILRITLAAATAAACMAGAARAEDIDLFTASSGGGTAPNILIVLDNSANWNANNQQWAIGKQGESELRALHTVVGDSSVNTTVNLGLMMFSSSNAPQDSAYIRFHIRNMTNPNKLAFQELIGDATCSTATTHSLTGKKKCILKDFSSNSGQAGNATNNSGEMTNSASTRYSGAMFEAFKYFGGYTKPSLVATNTPGTPVSSTQFGPAYFSTRDLKFDPFAYSGANYISPIDASNSCAKNYIIFIGNGYPSQDSSTSYLSGIGGDPTVPAPVGNKANIAANWAKYLYTTDVSSQGGVQNVATYTIDVFNAQQDTTQTALLKAMAKYGGGRYFEARNEQAIINALREIIIEIQSVNSVFASASLPINATNRSQNENQVFIGMFRPDGDAKPKWYGNLKQFQIGLFGGDAKLADKNGTEAVSASTGFIQACSTSFWTVDSGNTTWDWSPNSAGSCTTVANSMYNDLPDGGVVEKGGAAEFLRRGNSASATAPFSVNRTMYTCAGACTGSASMVALTTTSVTQAALGAASTTERDNIVKFTKGEDVLNENGDALATALTEPRASIHGDIAHSRPLPVNFGGTRKVEVFYGANDGTFRAVQGETGKELWSFVAPEHHTKLKRLYDNSPVIKYPSVTLTGALAKDYFFDGASGLYQNADNSKVWLFPTMRRGGRMLYAFDVSASTPVLKWSVGCQTTLDTSCTNSDFSQMGQTWSGAQVAFIHGYSSTEPVIIMGGGYDTCLDNDAAASICSSTSKGNRVFVIKASDGTIIKQFTTERPVPADVTLIDRDFDGSVDHAYVADSGGAVYRIDFVNPSNNTQLAFGSWTMTKIASTTAGNRKFLFGPAALSVGKKVYLALGSGDRERPLITNYPYTTPVTNRFYSFIDSFTNVAYDLDGSDMTNYTSNTTCATVLASGKNGWYMDLEAGRGEQTVTSAVIFGGTVFFSTNRPVASTPGSCSTNLGEARGYAVNLLNASGVIGTGSLCGGSRSGTFTGGGIPPSPVVGIVPILQPDGTRKPTNVLIGGINLETGGGGPIEAQEPKVNIKALRSRLYWYPHGER